MIHQLIDPFREFAFMRRALVGCLALSLGGPPIGVFLVLRRTMQNRPIGNVRSERRGIWTSDSPEKLRLLPRRARASVARRIAQSAAYGGGSLVGVGVGTYGLLRFEAIIAKRRSAWKQPEPRYTRGVQAKFAFNASSASKGAVLDLY